MPDLVRKLFLFVIVNIIRIIDAFILFFTAHKRPLVQGVRVERIKIPSRDRCRSIAALKYTPEGATGKLPVYLSWHASGFMLKRLGIDRHMHSLFCKELNTVVIDAAYRKSPEHKFPAAHQDAEDVLLWVIASMDQFDTSKIVLGGSSAGGNIALNMSVRFYPRIKGCFALYASTMLVVGQRRRAPNPNYKSGVVLSRLGYRLIGAAHFSTYEEYNDLRFNAINADTRMFPDYMLFACGDADSLYSDSKHLFEKVQSEGSKTQRAHTEFLTIPNEAHEFNNIPRHPDSYVARDKLYAAAIDMIRAAQAS
ncbi:hypothetical protein MVES1_002114 [Malassezia vespertilionis]|uniref:Alpha/beta hydrolase fold-3 domain-containing protein n=1 Tax=Malassezia vespertilionis TaxID=2020962 RepID=A0A2N1JBL2_9BASI|nr:uncharacterized protein MVES1_002114 [Malassezia vespertilionis]PKI83912.1 hypothetical protein MVES_001995 [Malassezia vespertilionis]WFD06760.1 hypothetical protein MVES1_002114 [Malassezia vespertilionis]